MKKLSAKKACKSFQVLLTSLRDRLDCCISFQITSSGPVSFLGRDVEQKLFDHAHYMATIGNGYTRLQIIDLASQYVHSCSKLSKTKSLSQQWFNGFIKCWPYLKNINPSSLDSLRAQATSSKKMAQYFKDLENILNKYDLKDRPDLIYNIDKKGISCENKPPYVVCSQNFKPQAITSSESANNNYCNGKCFGQLHPPIFCVPWSKNVGRIYERHYTWLKKDCFSIRLV